VAGNPTVINGLRVHNSEFCVMIPEFCQAGVAAALRASTNNDIRRIVQARIRGALDAATYGWRRLGWPDQALITPDAGFKFLLRPPPAFATVNDGIVTGVELFDFLIARDAAAKLSTSRSFNVDCADWVRMIIMQDVNTMNEFFDRLNGIGIHYNMDLPPGLAMQFLDIVAKCDLWNL